MPAASAWYHGNDMLVRLAGLKSSTMASGTFLTSSTGVTCDLWGATSTASTGDRKVSGATMTYTGSSGRYEATIQSTQHGMTRGTVGMAIIRVQHGTLTGEWRPHFRVDERRVT
jgi:hypothetical protein